MAYAGWKANSQNQRMTIRIDNFTLHIHLSKGDCMEAIAVKGKAREIRHLSDELATKEA